MFKQFTEYRDMQKLRKDHKRKQTLQYSLILSAILGVLLVAAMAIESMQTPSAKAEKNTNVSNTQATPTATADRAEITTHISAVEASLSKIGSYSNQGIKAAEVQDIAGFCAAKSLIDNEVKTADAEMAKLQAITDIPANVNATYTQVKASQQDIAQSAAGIC